MTRSVGRHPTSVTRLTPAPMPVYARATLAELLRARRDAVLSACRARPNATAILDWIASSSDVVPELATADVEQTVADYQALRRVVHGVNAREARALPFEELRRFDDKIDRAILATIARARRDADALRSSEARLRTMFDHSPAAMFIKDADGRFVMANRSCATLLGGAPEDIVGRLEQEIVAPEVAATHLANDRVALEGGGPIEIEEWLPFHGEQRKFLSIKFAISSPNVRPLVCGIATDITDRKRIEDGQAFLLEAGRILGASLEFEDTLTRVARLSTSMLADACAIDIIEGRELRRFGFSPDPSKEDVMHDFLAAGVPSLDSMRPAPLAIRTRTTILIPVVDEACLDHYETPENLRRALRAFGIQSLIVAPLLGRTEVIGAVGFGACHRRYGPLDVAIAEGLARVAADAIENARLSKESQEAMRHREDVLAIVSHDLRSPLAAIRAAEQALSRCTSPTDVCAKHLGVVRRASQRMERMIGDLLQATAIRTGHMVVSQRPERLSLLLAEAIDSHNGTARHRGISVVRAFGPDSTLVSCDRDRIVQVLSNLLGNSLKFCRQGDTITVGSEASEREVRVFVSDTGPGIEEGDVARLFDPYWSARRHKSTGTGLGLYISKGLVEAHGGRLGVESRVGAGSTFWFTLPRVG
ncbi:MAG: ATP-binding protein [Polyangiales bacterium]